jgi:hypothetical protein
MECERKKLMGQQLQTKLRINAPGDEYEQEADRVAEQIMHMAEPGKEKDASTTTVAAPLVQRKVSADSVGIATAPPIVHDVLESPGQPLDVATLAFFEPRFGHDFSNVRVHTNVKAEQSAATVNAVAYTVGRDIVFAARQHSLSTTAGQWLLAHELVHVQQQAAGSIGQIQRSLPQTGAFAQLSDQVVRAHIEDALAANGNDLEAAWKYVQHQRCLPQNCLDQNLAAAEHYMFARFMVEELLTPASLMIANILAYSVFKFVLSAHGIEVPAFCDCPATPTSVFQVRWGLTGVGEGQASLKVRDSVDAYDALEH